MGKCEDCVCYNLQPNGDICCHKYPLEYIGYDSNNSKCQSCKLSPTFPTEPYNCPTLFASYSGVNTGTCQDCLRYSRCDVRIETCNGLYTSACDECPRKTDSVYCLECYEVKSTPCQGLDSEMCKECPRPLVCKSTCPIAYRHAKIDELCVKPDNTVKVDEEATLQKEIEYMTMHESLGGAIKDGAIKEDIIKGGLEELPIEEAPIEEEPIKEPPIVDNTVYTCDLFNSRDDVQTLNAIEQNLNVVEEVKEITRLTPKPRIK